MLSALASPVTAQVLTKEDVYRLARQTYQQKIPAAFNSVRTAAELQALFQHKAPESAERTASELRSAAELRISDSPEAESEIHAAANPTDSNNLIVAAMKFSDGLLGGQLSFPVYFTEDFGQSWQLSTFDGSPDTGSFLLGGGDPIIAFDSKGTAYLSWLTFTVNLEFKIAITLNWALSTDGGRSWQLQEDPIDQGVVADLEDPQSRFVDKQWMATDHSDSPYRDNLYTAYAAINLSDTSYQIIVKTKDADSGSFGAPVIITPEEFLFAQFTSIDVDRQGNVHLLFAGGRAEDNYFGLYHCRSGDGGQTFSAPVRISDFTLNCFPPGAGETSCTIVGIDSNRVYPSPHLRVDASGGLYDGSLYVTWTAHGTTADAGRGMDVYFSRSTDNGATWTPATVLNDDGLAGNDQFFSSLAVNDRGTLVLSWYDRREDAANLNTKYYLTWSDDGGQTFRPAIAVSNVASDFSMIGLANGNFGIGEYTQVVVTDGYAIPFWADGRDNDGNIEVFTAQIALSEMTTSLPTVGTVSPGLLLQGPYPNPASNLARLDLQLAEPSTVALGWYNLAGQLIRYHDQGKLLAGKHELKLPVKELENGQYLLVVETELGLRTLQVSVVK